MTRLDLLRILVGQARANGFELRRWYTTRLNLPWISAEAAFAALDSQRRYYALLFSHEFAQTFWKEGADVTFQVPEKVFHRLQRDGTTRQVVRKPYVRRITRPGAWKWHLQQMALAEEPLRYMRKYLNVEEELDDSTTPVPPPAEQPPLPSAHHTPVLTARKAPGPKPKRAPKPLPKDPPHFLRRPYP